MKNGDVYLIEVLAGLTVLGFSTWMAYLCYLYRELKANAEDLEKKLQEHLIEAENRLTVLEEKFHGASSKRE